LAVAIPNFGENQYGLITGLVFNLPFALGVLMTGTIFMRFNRLPLLGIVTFIFSLTNFGMASAHNLGSVYFYRIILGMGEAFVSPGCYSLNVDFIPAASRTLANSIF